MFLQKFQTALPTQEDLAKAEQYAKTIEALQSQTTDIQRFILRSDGSIITLAEWQKEYVLTEDKVGKYFSVSETKFQGSFLLAEPLIKMLDIFRMQLQKPVTITSAFRTEARQAQLISGGNKGAVSISPHCGGFAADIACTSASDVRNKADLLKKIAKGQGLKIRIGFNQYLALGSTFVHIDVCPEYFGKDKPFEFLKNSFAQWSEVAYW